MTSLIEQAALRLAQLREAGIVVPEPETPAAPQGLPRVEPMDLEAAARPLDVPSTVQLLPSSLPPRVEQPMPQSRRVEIDLDAVGAAGIVTPNAPRTRLADQYRVIKRPLIANATGRGAATLTHGNLIMVTSAVAGEGKTQTSLNLAISIAMELDHTVLLVEADVLRPSALARVGVQASHGLLDLLETPQTQLPDVLLRTNIPKLTLLPAGTASSRSTGVAHRSASTVSTSSVRASRRPGCAFAPAARR